MQEVGPVLVDLSMSLDGFIAGAHDGPENPLGDGGGRLFAWWSAGDVAVGSDERFAPPSASREVVHEMMQGGALITGRRTFDIADGWGGHHPFGTPFFVLTHRPIERWVGRGTDGTAVYDGVESALNQARAVAGSRAIAVGAADVAQQFLRAGLLDEVRIHLVPVLLGSGIRLFDHLEGLSYELECLAVVPSSGVTHLRYRVHH